MDKESYIYMCFKPFARCGTFTQQLFTSIWDKPICLMVYQVNKRSVGFIGPAYLLLSIYL